VRIDDATLQKLEKLSHLKIAKREEILAQLSEILGYVENLNELDTDKLESDFSALEGGTPLREDRPVPQTEVPRMILDHAP